MTNDELYDYKSFDSIKNDLDLITSKNYNPIYGNQDIYQLACSIKFITNEFSRLVDVVNNQADYIIELERQLDIVKREI